MNRKLLTKFVVFLIMSVSIISLLTIKKFDFDVSYTTDTNINEPITFSIKSFKNGKPDNLGKIDIKLYNQYNKDERFDSSISTYNNNEYKFIYSPSLPGNYLFSIVYLGDNGEEFIFNETIYVK